MISVDSVFMKNYQTYLNENYQSLLGSHDDPEVWNKRGYIVRFSLIDFEDELDPIEKVAEEHPKCYQCWYYRRWIVKKIGSKALANELKFTRELLWTKGKRNYLAWSHIQWNINKFGRRLWLDELQFCHQILKKDKYNVWAWDQICRAVRLPRPGSREMPLGEEITFAKKAIRDQPGNEGPWIYLKILYADDKKRLYTSPDLECIYVDVLAEAAFRLKYTVRLDPSYKVPYASVDNRGCIHALNLIVDLMVLGYQADRNKRLVEAVDFLFDKYCCSLSFCGRLPVFIQMMNSEISRKVHALMHSFDASRIRYCYMYKEFTEIPKIDTVDKPCETVIMDIPVRSVISPRLQGRLQTILYCFITSVCQEHKVFNKVLSSYSELHPMWRKELHKRLCEHYLQRREHLCRTVNIVPRHVDLAVDDTLEDLICDFRQFVVNSIGTSAPFNELLYKTGIIKKKDVHSRARSLLHRKLVSQTFDEDWVHEDWVHEDDSLEDLNWALRQFIVKKIGTRAAALAELDYTTSIIKEDAYNRHAWSHRQWVFQTFDEDWVDEDGAEIEFTRRILDEDSCNSYAWDQRYFVVTRWISIIKSHCDGSMEPGGDAVSEEVVKFTELVEQHMNREIDYAINVIGSEPENQFPWSHIYGVYKVCYRYSATSFFVPKVGDAILSVLQGARDCVLGLDAYGGQGIMGSDRQVASLVNARGVMNALNMLSDIISNRRITTKIDMDEYRDVLKVLCPSAFVKGYEWEIRIRDRTYAILEHLRKGMAGHGLLWENAADGYGFRFCE